MPNRSTISFLRKIFSKAKMSKVRCQSIAVILQHMLDITAFFPLETKVKSRDDDLLHIRLQIVLRACSCLNKCHRYAVGQHFDKNRVSLVIV